MRFMIEDVTNIEPTPVGFSKFRLCQIGWRGAWNFILFSGMYAAALARKLFS